MTIDFTRVNESCLSAFGQDFTLTHSASGISETISGILESAGQLEEAPPGDDSTYAILWLPSGSVTTAPVKGDEIASTTTIYSILRLEQDAGGGLRMLLRKDRTV